MDDTFGSQRPILPSPVGDQRVTPMADAYLRLLAWRPDRAIAIAYWYLAGRRVRARNRLRNAIANAPFAYDVMMRDRERQALLLVRDYVVSSSKRPLFSIVVETGSNNDSAQIAQAIRSVTDQPYDHWEVLLVGRPSQWPEYVDPRIRIIDCEHGATPLTSAIEAAQGHFIVPLAQCDALSSGALLRFAEASQAVPGASILYGDEDTIDRRGRRYNPWFKPQWNAEMVLALDFVSHACAIDVVAARRGLDDPAYIASGTAYGLVLAVTRDETVDIVHVPHVIAHVPSDVRASAQTAQVAAVAARVAQAGGSAEPGVFGTVTVRWPLPDPPPAVTILVPTRDRAELVRACIDSLLARTTYPNYIVIVIDNGSIERATKDYFAEALRDPRVQVLPCDMPYNFSAINNVAVERTGGDYLCFLNNDTEVIDGNWLSEMMRYAVRPGIGAVGAQLLYEDRSIQHAGVVMGLGNAAGHAHRALAEGDAGYFAQAHAAHYASAVTAACLVVEKSKFLSVGGFDAEHLQIAYNDVDLCLKLGRAGWRNVYAPQAKLLHLESKSRGADLSPEHVQRYMRELAILQKRWDTTTIIDPLHHPALDRDSETYRPAI
jgi:GT2 family glycosyltransferase